jgi:hypothetical protein
MIIELRSDYDRAITGKTLLVIKQRRPNYVWSRNYKVNQFYFHFFKLLSFIPTTFNHIGGVMVSVLASGRVKPKTITFCIFFNLPLH